MKSRTRVDLAGSKVEKKVDNFGNICFMKSENIQTDRKI